MGRMLGAFDPNDQLDRPDLNKCPDCGCYFAGENCPLCGKPCPEEMRAGNRKEAKPKRQRRGSAGRVTFVDWYHRWWFIVLMMFFFPLVGIILLLTSPHKRWQKITFVCVGLVYFLVNSYGLSRIIGGITNLWDHPVDTKLSREEYVAACETVDPEDYYRAVSQREDDFVTVTVVVKEKIIDIDAMYNNEKYTTYYICEDPEGRGVELLIRDCNQETPENFRQGDVITVFGEGAGECTVYDMNYEPRSAPCIHMAYVVKQ